MKKRLCIHLCLFFIGVPLLNLKAQQTAPFSTIESFFKAFHDRDSLQLQKYFAAEAQISFTTNNELNQPSRRTIKVNDFINRVCHRSDTPVWEERIGKPEIQIHQNLATIWVPFQFYLDGKFSHQGYNFFLLFWKGTHWEILYLSDTREK